jgi:hypothetical protein
VDLIAGFSFPRLSFQLRPSAFFVVLGGARRRLGEGAFE